MQGFPTNARESFSEDGRGRHIAAIDARQYASDMEFTLIVIGFNLWKYHNKTRLTAETDEIA